MLGVMDTVRKIIFGYDTLHIHIVVTCGGNIQLAPRSIKLRLCCQRRAANNLSRGFAAHRI